VAKTKYAIFDRDGTIIEHVPYLTNISQVKIVPGVFETLEGLCSRGYHLGIATNQSVIGKNLSSLSEVEEINHEIVTEIETCSGVKVDFVKLCPHLVEDMCICRKPKPGLIIKEIEKFDIDCANSYMIGDSFSDVEFGRNLGMRTILINNPRLQFPVYQADYIVETFSEILDII